MALRNGIFNNRGRNPPDKEYRGFLVCPNCKGYYELEEGESPDDFEACECGGPLEYHETLDKFIDSQVDGSKVDVRENLDEYLELQKIINVLSKKALERKELLKKLSDRITIQEELLKEIKEERWSLWEILEERNVENDIKGQKSLLDSIVEQEDKLLSQIKQKRVMTKEAPSAPIYMSSVMIRVVIIVTVVIGFILLLILLMR